MYMKLISHYMPKKKSTHVIMYVDDDWMNGRQLSWTTVVECNYSLSITFALEQHLEGICRHWNWVCETEFQACLHKHITSHTNTTLLLWRRDKATRHCISAMVASSVANIRVHSVTPRLCAVALWWQSLHVISIHLCCECVCSQHILHVIDTQCPAPRHECMHEHCTLSIRSCVMCVCVCGSKMDSRKEWHRIGDKCEKFCCFLLFILQFSYFLCFGLCRSAYTYSTYSLHTKLSTQLKVKKHEKTMRTSISRCIKRIIRKKRRVANNIKIANSKLECLASQWHVLLSNSHSLTLSNHPSMDV